MPNAPVVESPTPVAPIERSTGSRWTRPLAIILIGIAIAASVSWFNGLAPLRTTAGPRGWRVFHEPKNDWTVQYPESWHAQRIKEVRKGSPYTSEAYGILISNIDRRFEHPRLPKGSWSFGFDITDVPDTFAAVQVMWSYPGGFVMRCTDANRFPLSLKMAKTEHPTNASNPGLEELSLSFSARHEPLYRVNAWRGSKVSSRDRERLERIVASIRFADGPPAPIPPPPNCFG